MNSFTLTLTPTEEACGVTLDKVAELLPKCAFFDNGKLFMLPKGTAPALAGAVARAAFAAPAEFSHLTHDGSPLYRRAVTN